MLDADVMENALEVLRGAEERLGQLLGRPVRVRFVFTDSGGHPPAELVTEVVCRACGISRTELLSAVKTDPVVLARYHCFHLMSRYLRMAKVQIGSYFGKNHATVINGLRQHALLLETSAAFREQNGAIEQSLLSKLSGNEDAD